MARVYFTELAYLQLLVEIKKYCRVETGAILVGQAIGDDFYVFESLDSGINCRRSPSIFYRDNPYSEHLVDVVRAKYKKAYAIGFWHRHPGGFNQFSYDDRDANIDMVRVLERNIISGLVNICDNRVNLRFWRISLSNSYDEAQIYIGDKYFDKQILSYKSIKEVQDQILTNENDYGEYQHCHRQNDSSATKRPSSIAATTDEAKRKKHCLFQIFHKKNQDEQGQNGSVDPQARLLSAIYDDLKILTDKNIKCEKYRIDNSDQMNKVALNFYNLMNNKQCDVVLYFSNEEVVFYLDGTTYQYKKQALSNTVIKLLEDGNGRIF